MSSECESEFSKPCPTLEQLSSSSSSEASPPEKKQKLDESSLKANMQGNQLCCLNVTEPCPTLEQLSSSSSSEASPPEKKQKLDESSSKANMQEKSVPPDVEAVDCETSSESDFDFEAIDEEEKKELIEYIIGSSPEFKDWDTESLWKLLLVHGPTPKPGDRFPNGKRLMTDAEYKEYNAALAASRGFHVPSLPEDVTSVGRMIPLKLDVDENTREKLKPVCLAAVDYLKSERNVDYKYQKLEKDNTCIAGNGVNHYLTFQAFNPVNATTETFEAVVLMGIPEKEGDDFPYTVLYCEEAKADSGKTGTKVVVVENFGSKSIESCFVILMLEDLWSFTGNFMLL
ncbi:hypothetical protein CCACVL1_26727 [Corchorus capsularis]|uniref:Uncharacterized protein n=1 Tax=Corchorus capsularis TaxID=210143 RepID=A0A1R3GDL4_COCAP|nr:hypothetical protein CCACVL1_26727 [Corchorus capsularis]